MGETKGALLHGDALLSRFRELVDHANAVDIATAWATTGPALDTLRAARESHLKLRVVVGVAGNVTQPNALAQLQAAGALKVYMAGRGDLFHNKLYIFHLPAEVRFWIGSCNLTRGGFGRRFEMVWEGVDEEGIVREYFDEALWVMSELSEYDSDPVQRYIADWEPPRNPVFDWENDPPKPTRRVVPRSRPPDPNNPTWLEAADFEEYYDKLLLRDAQLKEQAAGWRIFGTDEPSYEALFRRFAPLKERDDWTALTDTELSLLIGRGDVEESNGLMGDLRSRRWKMSVLREHAPQLWQQLQTVTSQESVDNSQLVTVFSELKAAIRNNEPALASRLLALARPDRCISIANQTVRDRLANLASVMPASRLREPGGYRALLSWLVRCPWHFGSMNVSAADPRKTFAWEHRAALIDAFLYPFP